MHFMSANSTVLVNERESGRKFDRQTQLCCFTFKLLIKSGRCLSDNIHKDFRKAIGANCVFYSASANELVVLVSAFLVLFVRSSSLFFPCSVISFPECTVMEQGMFSLHSPPTTPQWSVPLFWVTCTSAAFAPSSCSCPATRRPPNTWRCIYTHTHTCTHILKHQRSYVWALLDSHNAVYSFLHLHIFY